MFYLSAEENEDRVHCNSNRVMVGQMLCDERRNSCESLCTEGHFPSTFASAAHRPLPQPVKYHQKSTTSLVTTENPPRSYHRHSELSPLPPHGIFIQRPPLPLANHSATRRLVSKVDNVRRDGEASLTVLSSSLWTFNSRPGS